MAAIIRTGPAVIALTLIVGACGSDDDDAGTGAGDTAPPASTADEVGTSEAAGEGTSEVGTSEAAGDGTTISDGPAVDTSEVDWATVDVTSIDWANIDISQVDVTALENNPTVENLDEETIALIQSRLAEVAPGSSGGGGQDGSLVFGGEVIVLGPGRCFLQEQPAAAGGGVIELTGQASGTNADGEPVVIDFTRFSEDSQFAGDDISVTIGDPFSADSTTSFASHPIGTVSLDGNTLSATDFSLIGPDGEEQLISFEIAC